MWRCLFHKYPRNQFPTPTQNAQFAFRKTFSAAKGEKELRRRDGEVAAKVNDGTSSRNRVLFGNEATGW
jgi:hypothetical protein